MPMVGGKKFAYTEEGKKKAKKAAVAGMLAKKKGKKKQNWSGAKSQLGY
jgi:hypothetical protein